MAGRSRALVLVPVLAVMSVGAVGLPAAVADPVVPAGALLDEVDAMAQAKRTGVPVVASTLTDEHTLVTADPVSGGFVAELTAGVARVRDGAGGWRVPSALLVVGKDGLLRPEAAMAQISLSGGGAGAPVALLSDGVASARIGWDQALPRPVVEGDAATYPEVFPGVDLVARAGLDSVETFLVVKSAAAAKDPRVRQWSVPVQLSGVVATSQPNGALSLTDPKGVERLQVPPARMWDSTGKRLACPARLIGLRKATGPGLPTSGPGSRGAG